MRFLFLGERLAVDLLNTVVGQDLLQSPRDVAAWAEAAGVLGHGALGGSAAGQEPERLRGFRETLRRALVAWAVGRTHPRGLIALLNRHLARDPEVSEVTASRGKVVTRRRPAGAPLDHLYGAVARSAAELLVGGDPRRLRKCANPSCRLCSATDRKRDGAAGAPCGRAVVGLNPALSIGGAGMAPVVVQAADKLPSLNRDGAQQP